MKLLNNSEREGTVFAEFVPGKRKANEHWNKKSVYLDDDVYNYFFSKLFQESNEKFNYFGESNYKTRNLKKLLELLRKNYGRLASVKNLHAFIALMEFYSPPAPNTSVLEVFAMDGIDWKTDWGKITEGLLGINRGLIEMVENCITKKMPLWVLGV